MISYDTHARRMVDTENGDYLLSQLHDREAFEWSFMLYDRHSQPLLGSVMKVANIDEFGDSGGATLSRCTLLKTWIPSGRPEPPDYFDETHPLIPRLAAFLEARLYAQGKQNPHPRFEFVDGRNQDQTAEALAWAQSYQQNPQAHGSSSRPNPATAGGILLGLLLTLLFHLLQVLWLPLVKLNDKYGMVFFYFGFTQLLYMLPAIYLARRDGHRGVMIGLIIGASLTFLLGLPIAGLALICGQMVH